MPESPRDAADAVREYAKGIDRAIVMRRLFVAWIALTVILALPYTVLTAEAVATALIDDFEDGDTNIETGGWSGWSGSIGSGSFTATSTALRGDFSGEITQENNNVGDSVKAVRDSGFTPDRWSFLIQFDSLDSSEGDDNTGFELEETGSDTGVIEFRVGGDGSVNSLENGDSGVDLNTGVLYNVTVYNIDYSNNDFDLLITKVSDGTTVVDITNWNHNIEASSVDTIEMSIDDRDSGETQYRFDDVRVEDPNLLHTVSGTVKFENGTAMEGATVSINATGVGDNTTDANGKYSFDVENGTYKITADKSGFDPNSTTVTVNGSDVDNLNLTLASESDLRLEVPSHMWQNQTADYTVWDESGDSKVDVTDNATVTSADPTNLSVDESAQTISSTSDLSVNKEIKVTAEFNGTSVSKNVTVANKSVENVDLMQNAADMTAALWGDPIHPETGDRQGGSQLTMRVLFIAVLLGAAIVPLASAFAGIGVTTLVVAMGWFMGWVGDGMALVTVFTGLFIGLNVAANIDYSVRR